MPRRQSKVVSCAEQAVSMHMRAKGHSPNSCRFVSSPRTAVAVALSQSSLRKALVRWLLKPNFHFTCSTAVSGLQLVHPIFHEKNSQQILSVCSSFHLEELHRGPQKGCVRKKAEPSFSPLTSCTLPTWAILSRSMSAMLKFHQFGVLIWKCNVNMRKQKELGVSGWTLGFCISL